LREGKDRANIEKERQTEKNSTDITGTWPNQHDPCWPGPWDKREKKQHIKRTCPKEVRTEKGDGVPRGNQKARTNGDRKVQEGNGGKSFLVKGGGDRKKIERTTIDKNEQKAWEQKKGKDLSGPGGVCAGGYEKKREGRVLRGVGGVV